MSLTENFLKTINLSFKFYNEIGGARSNKKLIPIHQFFSQTLSEKLGKDYTIKSLGFGKEEKVEGKYYPKNLDVAILLNKRIISTISIKFVTSNYKQNSNNYFENLMGECANIRRIGAGFSHFLILRGNTPYYKKNKDNLRGELKEIQKISQKNIIKYIKLNNDIDNPHKPDLMGILIIDFDENNQAYLTDLSNPDFKIDHETQKIIKNNFCLENFIDKFVNLVNFKT